MKNKILASMLMICLALGAAGCENPLTKDAVTNTNESESGESKTAAENSSEGTAEKSETASAETADGRITTAENVSDYVKIGAYKGLQVEDISNAVTDEAVEAKVLEKLKSSAQTIQDGIVQNGDIVEIDYVGSKDGVEFEGGTGEDVSLEIGSGTFIPGFEDGILGMKPGDSKDLNLTFPQEYHAAELAGQAVVFHVVLETIRRPGELTDAWVAANTEYATVDAYHQAVRTELEEEYSRSIHYMQMSMAWSQVINASEIIDYPEGDLERAKKCFDEQALLYARQGNMSLDDFIESQGMTKEQYDQEAEAYAKEKVFQNLVIQGIADVEGLTFEGAAAKAAEDQLVSMYGVADRAELVSAFGETAVEDSVALFVVEEYIIGEAVLVKTDAADPAAEPASEAAPQSGDASAENTAENASGSTAGTENTGSVEAGGGSSDASASAGTAEGQQTSEAANTARVSEPDPFAAQVSAQGAGTYTPGVEGNPDIPAGEVTVVSDDSIDTEK